MISAGDQDQPDARPRAGARLSAMRGRLALTGRRRVRDVLWLVLGLVLCGQVVSVLASPGLGRASQRAVGRGGSVAVVARRQRLAELDVSAAAVKLLAGNVLAGSATVSNVGSARARSSTAAVAWKSSDSGGLVQLGRFTVPALKASQRHKARFQVDLPKGASGRYEVSVCADVLGQVQERSKKNNCRDAGVITVPGSGVKASGPTSSEPSSPSGSPPGGSSTPPASSPPDTVIDSGPSGIVGQSSVTFTFHGSDTNDTFQCSLDGAPWASCTSPQQYSSLAEGAHTFQVRAINAADEVDPTPASASFTVEATPPQTTITSAPSGRVPIGEVSISFTSTEAGSSFQCSLDGAAYSPCGSPDVVKDPAAGPHTFKVQATNQAGVKETATRPSASWSSVEPQHDLCGTISSNTAIGPDYAARYIITCTVTVANGATLTAQPGTVVKGNGGNGCDPGFDFGQECSIEVKGSLVAVGTASEPIVFTSINDNSVGGTTGSGTPEAGDWDGISANASGSLDIEHADISYARIGVANERAGAGAEGAAVLKNDTFTSEEYGAAVLEGPAPTLLDNSAINFGAGAPAFRVDSESLNANLLGGNSATGSGSQVVQLSGTLGTSSTLVAEPAAWSTLSSLVVPAGKTLTIAPGAVLKGDGGNGCDPGLDFGQECSIEVKGSLVAVGTASEPIVFTSINDNSVGGTTGSGTPEASDWDGISANASGSVDIEHADISYARIGVTNERAGAGAEGAAVLKNDTFTSEEYGAAVLEGPAPTLLDNSAINSGAEAPAFRVESESLNANLLGGNNATGADSQVVQLSGTLGTSSTLSPEPATWSTLSNLVVPAGKTLTIAPGAVLKGNGGNGCDPGFDFGQECSIEVKGSLVAVGTASEPIVFTSINDNSAGGTTGSGTPEAGDWDGISANASGSLDIEHADISYARIGVANERAGAGAKGAAVLKNDTFTSEEYGAAVLEGPAPMLLDNSAINFGAGAPAFRVDSESLNANLLGGNSATGSGSQVVQLSGTLGTSSTLVAEPAAWSTLSNLLVPAGKTLTIAPGAVVKGDGGNGCDPGFDFGQECSIEVKGSLVAVGTSAQPIVFTSINDNSAGGTTGSGTPEAGDWDGISANASGSVDIEHADISYARIGVTNERAGAGAEGVAVLKNDTFTSEEYGAAILEGPVPTLLDNSAINSGAEAPAFRVESESLNANLLGGNSATGEDSQVVQLSGTLGTSSTLTAEPAAWGTSNELDVPAGRMLTIAPGAVIKGSGGNGCGTSPGNDCSIGVEGSLVAVGTASEPITFTSINNDSIGGDTGSGTPIAGDWDGIYTYGEASVDLEHVKLSYATTGLAATTNKHVTVESDIFAHNDTALDVSATVGTNAAIHETWFDENGVALDGSSDWEPIEPCQYIPSMSATGNEYGPLKGSKPFISESEAGEILAALAIPETEDQLPETELGETDRITWSVLGCQPLDNDHPHLVVATPYDA